MIQAGPKDRIREYGLEEFAKTKGIDDVTDQEALTKTPSSHSILGIFRLVAFLEDVQRPHWRPRDDAPQS